MFDIMMTASFQTNTSVTQSTDRNCTHLLPRMLTSSKNALKFLMNKKMRRCGYIILKMQKKYACKL